MGVDATVSNKNELLGGEVVEINARLVIEIGVKQIAAATLAGRVSVGGADRLRSGGCWFVSCCELFLPSSNNGGNTLRASNLKPLEMGRGENHAGKIP